MGKSKKVPKYDGPDAEILDEAFDDIKEVIDRFIVTLVDGVQVQDYIEWYCLARESYDIAKKLFPDELKKSKAEVPDELEKKEAVDKAKAKVINIARYIYWAVDPNWPWIPEFIERKLEQKIICNWLIPMVVHNAWDAVAGYIEARKTEAGKKDDEDDDEKSWCKDCILKEYCPCPPCLKPLCPTRLF